jgi:hypothetical protein
VLLSRHPFFCACGGELTADLTAVMVDDVRIGRDVAFSVDQTTGFPSAPLL